jgi:hypothetical protein
MASPLRSLVLLLPLLLATPLPGAVAARADERALQDAGTAPQDSVADGAAITPEFAAQLFARVAPLQESDGCRLESFDTQRFRFVIGLKTPAATVHTLEVATSSRFGDAAHKAGNWALAASPGLERECGATLAAIAALLTVTEAPSTARWGADLGRDIHSVLILCFALLLVGTVLILLREAASGGVAWSAVLALLAISAVGLALRLGLSPRTFLHEYYHIAETVPGYLTGSLPPLYGKTGPAMFRMIGRLLGRPEDVGVIFLTNAIFAALAIPAVALLDLAVARNWPRALLAAALLCILPQHLRFSASEVLVVQATTFGFWATALFALYLRTRRLPEALCAALATALAMQARPEMMVFPALPLALLLLTQPRSWRLLLGWRSLVAFAVLVLLLVPRLLELLSVLGDGPSPGAASLGLDRFLNRLVLLDDGVTPALYRGILLVGLLWGLWSQPGLTAWVVLIFCGFSAFSLSLFDNWPANLRLQLLPTSFTVLAAAGAAPLWMRLWGARQRQAARAGLALVALLGAATVARARPFITELRDQQLEYAFLDRSAARLPERGRLLSAVDMGGRNLDAFPEFLLRREGRKYQLTDIRRAFAGEIDWPPPGEDLLFYQGMFCYFAFEPTATVDPMTPLCAAVHERYDSEPLIVEELNTQGYSQLTYARGGEGPYEVGFFRLRGLRSGAPAS